MFLTLTRFRRRPASGASLKTLLRHRVAALKVGLLALLLAATPPALAAAERTIRKDIDQDGRADQIAHYDADGGLLLLEVDSNKDGVMDRFQHYKGPELTRVEGDLDHDGLVDIKDYYEKGRRYRQEQLDRRGRIRQRALFDEDDNPLTVARDTTTDGRLDTEWQYKAGEIVTARRDADGDGQTDIWNAYDAGKPVSTRVDHDGDGQPDDEVRLGDEVRHGEAVGYDAAGRPLDQGSPQADSVSVAPHRQSTDTVERIHRLDRNNDGRPDVTTWLDGDIRRRQVQDTNFDGRDDLFFTFDEKGLPAKAEADTRHDGRINLIRIFAGELPLKDRLDTDNDGRLDTVVEYEEGRMVRQTRDKNQDGRPDLHFWFDRNGQRRKAESDSDFDGSIDTRYFYTADTLQKLERDSDGDGVPEMRLFYHGKGKRKLLSDKDRDGHFETIQWYAVAGWEQVIEEDRNRDGFAERRTYYLEGRPARREQDRNADGRMERVEWLNAAKQVTDRRDWPAGDGIANIIWPVGDDGRPYERTRDENANGRTDTWEYYSAQRLVARVKDRNHDGRPDSWALFAPSEDSVTLIEKRSDDDYDGVPDTGTLE
jgi:5-hydroxyisourate hydrolase-like protein (transthyretin family)